MLAREGFVREAKMAERERFELSEGLPSTVFKTVAFNRSATSPFLVISYKFEAIRCEI